MLKKLRLTLFLLIIINFCYSQEFGFKQFTINSGLPSNTVYQIVEDKNGFIWFATDYGVSQFDGNNFKNFTVKDGIPDNEIFVMFNDKKNRIWLSGYNGNIGFFFEDTFHNQYNTHYLRDLKFSNFIYEIFEDSKGNVWFMESKNQIKMIDSLNNVTSYELKNLSSDKNSKNMQLLEDINGNVNLISSTVINNEIKTFESSILNPKWIDFEFKKYNKNSINSLREEKTESLKEFDQISLNSSDIIFNHLKYPTQNNLLYKNISFKNYQIITNLNNGMLLISNGLNKKVISLLENIQTTRAFIDSEKNIWIGSIAEGVFFFSGLNITGKKFDSAKTNDIHSIFVKKNQLLTGNENGKVLFQNKKTLEILKTNTIEDKNYRIRKLIQNKEYIYVLSDLSISKIGPNNNYIKLKNIYDTDFQNLGLANFKAIDIYNNYIYTANANGVSQIDLDTGKVEKIWNYRSTAINVVNNDSIWIGTTNGLFLRTNDTVKKYNLNDKFNNTIIYDLKRHNNLLFIGSNSYGLGILNNENFKNFETKDGLLSNYIKSIFFDDKQNLWLSTNYGLNQISLTTKLEISNIKSYTTSDGLFSNDVRDCFVENNTAYVATSNGVNVIDLTVSENNTLEPRLYLNEVLVNNSKIEKIQNHQFKYNENNIQFNFSGISFKSLGKINYKYRLLGLENDWIETTNNSVRYSALPPNNYTFEFKAIAKNNIENKVPLSFSFVINRPFYKTWWFRSIMAVLILGTTISLYFRRQYLKREAQRNKEKIAGLKFQALNAQMNPHFINNLLVNIENLAAKGNNAEVKSSLSAFGKLVNLTLQATKSNLISLANEIEMAKNYLNLQQLRFNKNLVYIINTDQLIHSKTENILVPPMILQPIIENSIIHGFKNSKKEYKIEINFSIKNNDYLICEVVDNGCAENNSNTSKQKNSGISLKNINQRLVLLEGQQKKEKYVYHEKLFDEFNNFTGTKVVLNIPLITI
jgi:ligand-binding sensor domain-containing protein